VVEVLPVPFRWCNSISLSLVETESGRTAGKHALLYDAIQNIQICSRLLLTCAMFRSLPLRDHNETISSAVAEKPRDAPHHLKMFSS